MSRRAERIEVYVDAHAFSARILLMTTQLGAVSPFELEAISVVCRNFVPAGVSLDVITVNDSPAAPRSEMRLHSDRAAHLKSSLIIGDLGGVAELTGIEPVQTYVPNVADRRENTPSEATQDDSKRREVSASANLETASTDTVEAALAEALALAATAGRFDVVAQLARELEARRFARAGNVLTLDARQKGRR